MAAPVISFWLLPIKKSSDALNHIIQQGDRLLETPDS